VSQPRERLTNDPLFDAGSPADLTDFISTSLDTDATFTYGMDGFSANHTETCGATDPQEEEINLTGLAYEIYLLLRREALFERERLGELG
jgi:hypothetical protein